jgi:SAM-dependent methyltransferase
LHACHPFDLLIEGSRSLRRHWKGVPLPFLFAITLFTSAFLLFMVQPMVGKMVLPYLGGTPAVWNTCMVFFQAALLFGYLYAHEITRRFGIRRQLTLHLGLLLLPLVPLALLRLDVSAIARDWLPPPSAANPIAWLLLVLTVAAGLPFFVVATSAPLLQKWYSETGHAGAKDPYFLYGASNLGSMLALIGYPTLIEPNLRLATQAWIWAGSYVVLMCLTALCGVLSRRAATTPKLLPWSEEEPSVPIQKEDDAEVPLARRLRWIALAIVPSSLMLGVTTYITTDVSAIPLLWVIPLTIYLLSFILVFSRLPAIVHRVMVLAFPFVLVMVVMPNTALLLLDDWGVMSSLGVTVERTIEGTGENAMVPAWVVIVMHLIALFVAAMVCHGELARTRPSARDLTGFYVCLSVGGVLGGLFNALVAPMAFSGIFEYPLILAFACLLVPRLGATSGTVMAGVDAFWTSALVMVGLFGVVFLLAQEFVTPQVAYQAPEPIQPIMQWFVRKHGRNDGLTIHQERDFFGVIKIRTEEDGAYHEMVHGTTFHGKQCMLPGQRDQPLTYFHRQGPIGELFAAMDQKHPPMRIAVLGMGTGTLAAYADRDWEMTFYEIDPAVIRLARNPEYFTYIADAEKRGARITEVLGDGRLQLEKAPNQSYDLLFMDAFTSDAVPVHLITKEAVEMYLTKLAPDGVLVINIANRYLDLQPVLGNLGLALGLKVRLCDGQGINGLHIYASRWAVLARHDEDFGVLPLLPRTETTSEWREVPADDRIGLWTDDYSNLLQVYSWHGVPGLY